ncbi:MAG: sigma-54-dependent transcriptional regulator, partial [Limisphaerales bacterium]
MTAKPTDLAAPRILVVDDDPGQRSLLQTFLERNGHRPLVADSGEAALKLLAAAPVSMMISDVRMPGMTGLETLRRARQLQAKLPVLLVTAYADIREAVGAMRDGAVNYLSKPIDLDELLRTVEQITGTHAEAAQPDELPLPQNIIAVSPLMRAVFHDAALIAPSESRVLITGESGAGKEVLADAIHGWSPRAKGPLVKVNCAAIPETLLESELFGHEKGAFTGAHQARTGRFEEANGGAIFLDEISEMSPQLQAKLLRVTQEGRFRRIGSGRELQTDARILAATNRNLEALIKEGRFREDLFYRLAVVELGVPPLRERREDILPLATHFIAQFGGDKTRFASAVTECLERYPWPGNVRELRNAMERAALLSRGGVVLLEHLPSRVNSGVAGTAAPVAAD